MPEPLAAALTSLRPLLLDADHLVRAVAAGRRRGAQPSCQRATLRPVDLKDGRRLQVVTDDGQGPRTRNEAYGERPGRLPPSTPCWPSRSATGTCRRRPRRVQLRVTKKGEAQVHRAVAANAQHTEHDRAKPHLIDPGDPLFTVLGAGASKRRQVDAFLHMLAGVVEDAQLPRRSAAAGRRPRLRQRLPHVRGLPLSAPSAARRRRRHRCATAGSGAQQRARRPAGLV